MHEIDISPRPVIPVDIDLPRVALPGMVQVCAAAFGMASAPAVTGIRTVTVAAVVSTGAATAYGAVVTAVIGQSGLVVAVRAAATGIALPPAVTSVRSPTVNAPIAASIGVAYAAALGGATSANQFALVSAASATALVATVTAGAVVASPIAAATSTAGSVSVIGTAASTGFAVIATASANAFVPTVTYGVTVNAVVATANANAIQPLGLPVIRVAVLASSSGLAPIPTISGEAVLIGGGPGLGSALAYPPTVTVPTTTPPAFASSTTLVSSNSTTAAVPVPAGVVAGDVIIVAFYIETTQVVTSPTGFVEITSSPVVVTGTLAQDLRVYWKRAIAADTGTYTFTIAAGLITRQAIACRYTGCDPTDPVIVSTNSAIKTTSVDPNTPAVINSTVGSNRTWIWIASTNGVGGIVWTMPAGFTQRQGMTASNGLVLADMPQVVAGSSGSVVGSFSQNSSSGAWLGALKPA